MSYNIQQKLEDNIAAIKLALEWDGGAVLAEADKAILFRYVGFSGIKAVLLPEGNKESWQAHGASREDMKLYPGVMGCVYYCAQNSLRRNTTMCCIP